MKQVRVLITGAGGFVGGALAAGFVRLGAWVTGLDRTFDADARARLTGVELVECDLADGQGRLRDLSADVIIHADLGHPCSVFSHHVGGHGQDWQILQNGVLADAGIQSY